MAILYSFMQQCRAFLLVDEYTLNYPYCYGNAQANHPGDEIALWDSKNKR